MVKEECLRLMLITNKGRMPIEKYLVFVMRCVEAGITSIQLREKELSFEELWYFGEVLKKVLNPTQVPLIINDDLKLCLALNAGGVHLGQSDGDPIKVREKLGSDKIIGLSINTLEDIKIANTLPLDYIGVGAIYPTKNKHNVETIWGLQGLKQALKLSIHPIVCLGGLNENNISSLIHLGAKNIAAIGAFHEALDPYITTQNLIKIMNKG